MSSAPPPGREDENPTPADLERLIAAATDVSAEEEIAAYQQEAVTVRPGDPKRSARLLFEVGQLRERQGNVREAGKAYTQALTSDPTLQPNTWALFRLFSARGAWENLIRSLDAELRFAPLPSAADRADVLVEKGRVLEDRLGREAEARAAYRRALELDRAHPAALLALLGAALRAGATAEAQQALAGLVQAADDPTVRALLAVELARLERGSLEKGGEPERVKRAAETLFRALLGPAAEEPLCEELDRLSLAVDDPELRARVLDLLDSRLARDEAPWRAERALQVALHREKARLLLRRGAREAALAVLERGLRAAPGHPLLLADLLDVAEEAGRPDAIALAVEAAGLAPGSYRQHEALLRRAEAAGRAGALGEAIGSLDQVPADSRLQPLCALARVRILARLGDGEGLAKLFEEQGARSEAAAPQEAAHLLARAATIRLESLSDAAGARTLLERALALAPDLAPAREALRAALAELREWRALAGLYERQLEAASDPAVKQALTQSLLLLYRDLVRDPAATARHEQGVPAGGDELEGLTRNADQAGERFTSSGEAAEDAIRQLRSLSERAEHPAVAAGLRMLAARVSAQAGAERAALALAEEAFRCDAGSAAAAELERQYRAAGRTDDVLRVLEAELDASERAGRREASRALRFRLALQASEAGRTEQALAALAPLRSERDRAAALWSWELARAGKQPPLEAAVLAEPGVADALASRSEDGTGLRLLALAEAHEAGGDRAGAVARHQALAAWAEDNALAAARVEAALGLYRTQAVPEAGNGAEPPAGAAFAALARAAGDLPGAGVLSREAELLALATGAPPVSGAGDAPAALTEGEFAGAGPWLWSLRDRDPAARTSALAHLAEAADGGVMGVGAGEGAAVAGLWAVTGVRQLLTGEPGAAASLARAGRGGPDEARAALIAVALTDLGGPQPAGGSLAGLRVQRAERLAGEGPAGRLLAETLLLEQAEQAEGEGRGREAAECYARVLALAPESVEATEGLRRVAQAGGRRRSEAAALVRLGGLLRDPRRAAERFAEAALLFEDEGLREDAVQAFVEVLARVPDDDEAYRRLHALLAGGGRHAALERLLSFKLGRTTEGALRVALLGERAALRAGPLARRREAVLDHRRILALAPEAPESLRFLARLASEEGRYALAIPLYEGALAHRQEDEHSTALRLELAEAYEGAQRDGDAISVLGEAVEAQPQDPGPRERLIALAQRHRDYALAAEQLQALEGLTARPEQRAGLAVRRGRIERDQRHDRGAALAAFRAALELEPLGEAAGELVLTVGDEALTLADAVAVNHVIATLRHELATDPFDVRRLECLRDLSSLRGQADLRDVAAQLLAALGVGAARGRARDLVRPVSIPALGALGVAGDRDTPPAVATANEIWPHFAQGVARLYPRDPAEFGASKQTRVEAGLEPRLAWAESASVALGIPTLSFYVGGYEELAVNAFDVPEPCLVLGRGVVGGDPGSRFRVGRALALLRQQATVLDRISLPDLEMAFAAAGWLAAEQPHPRIDTATLKATAKRLARALSRRDIKSLESYEEAFSGGHVDVRAWKEAVLRTADRFGLLVGADLAVALRILAGGKAGTGTGPVSPADLRAPASLDLVFFALGDRYRTLRREVGLSRDER